MSSFSKSKIESDDESDASTVPIVFGTPRRDSYQNAGGNYGHGESPARTPRYLAAQPSPCSSIASWSSVGSESSTSASRNMMPVQFNQVMLSDSYLRTPKNVPLPWQKVEKVEIDGEVKKKCCGCGQTWKWSLTTPDAARHLMYMCPACTPRTKEALQNKYGPKKH